MTSTTDCQKSASHATRHFLHQRITAILLAPLSIWLLVFLNKAVNAPYAETTGWLASPVNAVALIAWVLAVFYHAALGVQVVIEDYVSTISTRASAIKATTIVFATLGFVALAAIVLIL